MKIAVGIAGVLLTLVAIVVGIGYSLPVKHRATRALTLHASTDSVFAVLSNPVAFPTWRPRVKQVEMIARADGRTSYRETGDDGAILYVVDESIANKHLVTRIANDKLPFGGTWTYELIALDKAPDGVSSSENVSTRGATLLRITEDGEVYNPIFRFVSRFVFGHHATIETYLKDLARKFGESATILP